MNELELQFLDQMGSKLIQKGLERLFNPHNGINRRYELGSSTVILPLYWKLIPLWGLNNLSKPLCRYQFRTHFVQELEL